MNIYEEELIAQYSQGVVTNMCPVFRSATAIKMKSRDQAHRQVTIKGSRRLLDQKSDQNQDNFAMPCILLYLL